MIFTARDKIPDNPAWVDAQPAYIPEPWETSSNPANVTVAGDIIRITTMAGLPSAPPCKPISGTEYINTITGAIGTYQRNDNRAQSVQSLTRTMRNIRDLVNANAADVDRLRWVTLTYAENMTDTARLHSDFDRTRKRVYRWCERNGYDRPEYIAVAEPQERGAWHLHLLMIWQQTAPFLPNKDLAQMWGQGYVKIVQPQDCDNIGAYLSAYLTDMPPDDDGKKHKGSRLHLYPPGMNILRHSKGIKKPTTARTVAGEAWEVVAGLQPTWETTYTITDDDGNAVQELHTTYYNRKRPDGQEPARRR